MAERMRDEKGVFLPSHGLSHGCPLYNVWIRMKGRCNNQSNRDYPRYGGRGIKVCDEWQNSFENFYQWAIENGYKSGLSIDRIDNDSGYLPNNCRWATAAQQNRNYSRNHLITYKGKTQCIVEWAEETGISQTTLQMRIRRGWDIDRLFDKRDGRSVRWLKK